VKRAFEKILNEPCSMPAAPACADVVIMDPEGGVSASWCWVEEPAIAALSRLELAVVQVLLAHAIVGRVAPGLGRRFYTHLARLLRRRKRRRERARMQPQERARDERLLRALRKRVGATRPIDPPAPLCTDLADVGLTPSRIVALLESLGIERAGVDAEAARKRVDERVRRARKR
jgi:hypothetical protein